MFCFAASTAFASSATAGRDHRLDERGRDRARDSASSCAVQPDDPAEGGQRIGFPRANVGLGGCRAGRHAARIRVLDDHRRRLGELERNAHRGVEIEQVRVRQLLALVNAPQRRAGRCARASTRLLMRVLAVAQVALHPGRRGPRTNSCALDTNRTAACPR